MSARAAIVDVGVFLPPLVGNDAWPPDVVARWRAAARTGPPPGTPDTEGVRATLSALGALAGDPFAGCVERPVMTDAMTTSAMEIAAARELFSRGARVPSDVDVLLHQSTASDQVVPSNAFALHEALGLRPSCGAFTLDAENDSFLAQLAFADALVTSGQARCALLVQSSQRSRLMPRSQPYSGLFGDGATAVLVVADEDGGALAFEHETDPSARGSYQVRSRDHARWHDGAVELIVDDPAVMQRHFLTVADRAARSIGAVLARAQRTAADVDAYVSHQPTAWFRAVTQQLAGLTRAKAWDTFAHHGSVGACNIPLALRQAIDRQALRPGELVAMFAGGAGVTTTSALIRWSAAAARSAPHVADRR